MNIPHKKLFVFAVIVVAAVIVGYTLGRPQKNTLSTRAASEIPPRTVVDEQEKTQETEMGSPDGSMTLWMNTKTQKGETTYTFSVSEKDGANKKNIYTKTVSGLTEYSIPFNTWSPDNAYVFLVEATGGIKKYLVFRADGAAIRAESQHLSVEALFASQIAGFTIHDVTGWASPTLLLVNAQSTDGDSSFWFEVPSASFIQLGTYFY